MSINVFKNTGIYFAVNLFSQVAVFVLWIVIAKVLPTSQIGLYALYNLVIDVFGAMALFGLNVAITRFYHSEKSEKEVFFNAFVIFLFANLLSFLMLLVLLPLISWFIPDIQFILKENFFLLVFLVIASSFYNLSLAHFAALKRVFWYAVISIIQTIIFFTVSFLLLLLFHFGIVAILYSLLISYFISSLIFLFKEKSSISLNYFSFNVIKSLLNYSFPMMLYATLGSIIIYDSRIFLDKYANLSILGIYSFFLMLTIQINAIFGTFNKAWTPEIFSQMKENSSKAIEYIKDMVFFISFSYLVCFCILIIIKQMGIFHLFLNEEYIVHSNIFYILLMAPLFVGIYTAVYPLFYYQKNSTKVIFFISTSLNILDIVLVFFMVKLFGEIGAALSFFIFYALNVFTFLIVFRKSIKISYLIVKWSFFLLALMAIGLTVLLKTSSEALFFVIIFTSAVFAYKYGNIKRHRHTILLLIKRIKYKLFSVKI